MHKKIFIFCVFCQYTNNGSYIRIALSNLRKRGDNVRNLIKKKMVDRGRDDFVTYLAELLGISKQAASAKLNGSGRFNEQEIGVLTFKLNFTPEELKNAVMKE